ncbi:MAG: hypothetical protein P8P66_07250 [Paracoccaceae bacterium]|nr:hypothetical protein [Paracoccaceae bacterium]
MADMTLENRPKWGLAEFILGAIALLMVVLTIAQLFGQSQSASSTSIGTSIGEIAAEIRQAAQPKISGDQRPEVVQAPKTTDLRDVVVIIAYVLAGISIIAGGISLYRGEPATLAKITIALGLSAIVMQYAFWMALLICGMMIITAVINNIGDILG